MATCHIRIGVRAVSLLFSGESVSPTVEARRFGECRKRNDKRKERAGLSSSTLIAILKRTPYIGGVNVQGVVPAERPCLPMIDWCGAPEQEHILSLQQ
jgi:hypothetical protein